MSAHSRYAIRCGAMLLVIATAAGCGASTPSTFGGDQGPAQGPTDAAGGSAGSAGAQATPAGTGVAGRTTGHLGDTLVYTDLAGDEIDVTLIKLTDPASPTDANNAAVAGTRWVGLEMTIDNHEVAPSDDSVQADGMGSDGQRYGFNTSYHIGGFAGCTATVEFGCGRPDRNLLPRVHGPDRSDRRQRRVQRCRRRHRRGRRPDLDGPVGAACRRSKLGGI